jgi:adenylate cyclase
VATQLLGGVQPLRRKAYVWPEAAASLGLAAAAIAAALLLTPAKGMAVLVFACALAVACAVLVHATSGLLADASFPVLGATSAFFATSLTRLAGERRARQAIERRFAMHLAPEIVARIIADPAALKLSGERRVVTALFTDIEGFTAMTEGAAPEDLVFLLDRYIELVCAAVRAHGGMVDKVVGDAVHAYFNAPVDLPQHADRALDAARNIVGLTQKLCADPLAARLGLGRTRIGIETGSVIVGDIGGATKLDYTAHGPAVNLAARLEAFCKGRTEAIAIGPGTVALLSPDRKLRIMGTLRASEASPEITVMTPDT